MKEKVTWLGETACDFCNKECTTELIDGKTIYGPWGVMCPDCFNKYGRGLGTGLGQKYQLQHNGQFEKIEG